MMEEMEVLMERSGVNEAGRDSQNDGFNSECLLPPDTDFMIDERRSPQVSDRLSFLEQRVQMQDDEIQLLKMAMADVLKRLDISEEQTAALGSRALLKAPVVRPASLSLRKSSGSTLASTPSPSPRTCSPRTPTASTKDPAGTKARTPGPGCRKPLETKLKPAGASGTGSRRVTHCKVTMQIYLRPVLRRTGSAEPPAAEQSKAVDGPALTALVQKRSCQNYKSPVKSPSQYFQICY